jgi:hypothetical protein
MSPTTQKNKKKKKKKQNKTFHSSNVPPKLPINYNVPLYTKNDKNTLIKYLEKKIQKN